ncbi:unnamed protein product [Meloidogyne enterolobii]|uniref:Uncharacterized protein n=1 Tax=Meloidogyne enterolobii TaxID=390850 RepID=A0ACB0YV29_MELEN
MRINASLFFKRVSYCFCQAEKFYGYDETNKTYIKFKEIVDEMDITFYDLIKKRIEIASCFIYTYSIIIEKASNYWDKNDNLTDEEYKKFNKEIKKLVGEFKNFEFKKTVEECERDWLTKKGKEEILRDPRKFLTYKHAQYLKNYLNNNQKEKEKLIKSFKSKAILANLIINDDDFIHLDKELKLNVLEGK